MLYCKAKQTKTKTLLLVSANAFHEFLWSQMLRGFFSYSFTQLLSWSAVRSIIHGVAQCNLHPPWLHLVSTAFQYLTNCLFWVRSTAAIIHWLQDLFFQRFNRHLRIMFNTFLCYVYVNRHSDTSTCVTVISFLVPRWPYLNMVHSSGGIPSMMLWNSCSGFWTASMRTLTHLQPYPMEVTEANQVAR